MVTIYLGMTVIPKMKQDKLNLYRNVVTQFHVMEISHCHAAASFWSKVLQNEQIRAASK
jgi:hypothetical protein